MATEVPDRIDRFQASYGTSARLNLWLNAHTVCGEIQRSLGGTGRPAAVAASMASDGFSIVCQKKTRRLVTCAVLAVILNAF